MASGSRREYRMANWYRIIGGRYHAIFGSVRLADELCINAVYRGIF